jgi:hypothetical protein
MNKYMRLGSLAACTSLKGTISNTFDRGCGSVRNFIVGPSGTSRFHQAWSVIYTNDSWQQKQSFKPELLILSLTAELPACSRTVHDAVHTAPYTAQYSLQLFWLDVLEQSPAASTNFITCSEKPLQFSQAVQWSCYRRASSCQQTRRNTMYEVPKQSYRLCGPVGVPYALFVIFFFFFFFFGGVFN